MFQNIRTNQQLYILHKEAAPYIEYGTVVNVSSPKPKYPSTQPFGQFPQVEMVVDVVVNIGCSFLLVGKRECACPETYRC